jgi:hypothetical protein
VTREVIGIIADLDDGLLVQDDVVVVPEDASEELKARMAMYEPYLRWAAGIFTGKVMKRAPGTWPTSGRST